MLKESCENIEHLSDFESKIIDNTRRIIDLESDVKNNHNSLKEKLREIEGDGFYFDENGNEEFDKNKKPINNQKSYSFSEAINTISQRLNINNGKIDKVIDRQNNINSEILTKLKKDLSPQSEKVLDEFRADLKVSIGKIEDQLRMKVDRLSLDEFGRKMDNKLNNEFNKKLDRNDLKKNNNLINRKIDTLENKISRTLVDTLIDLQMDDAPLIVKKSMNGGEKCASCNQVVLNGSGNPNNMGYNTFYGGASSFSNNNNQDDDKANMNQTQGKFKFRNIQDNSNKFGTGSYSRYLSNIDNVNEEIRKKGNNLPEINNLRHLKNTKNSTSVHTKIKIDELAGKQFNSIINEELEKNIINPDNLIKTANKIFEGVEKRNNIK
jgi:hypothetical protein